MKNATSTETAKVGDTYSRSRKRGCPTCDGVDPISCSRCQARSRLCDWMLTETGWHFIKPVKR